MRRCAVGILPGPVLAVAALFVAALLVLGAAPAASQGAASSASQGAAPAASQGVASAATALDRYLQGLVSWRAEFTQSTTDARGRMRPLQEGLLVVQRPGRFRWEIRGAGAAAAQPSQVMVADGKNLWFYDRDLEQVTVKPAGAALTATPAMLLAGTVPLRERFDVTATGRRGGLDWVRVAPRDLDAEFREARFGFAGLELRRLELDDKLGQQVVLVFRGGARNPSLPPAALRFEPPPGADLIGKPAR
jgi:outer membrane lipoprotein carrier protein